MKIVNVIPLVKIPWNKAQILTYWFPEKIKKGWVVKVPLGKREVFAIVESVKDPSQLKAWLKKESYTLKPIKEIINSNSVLTEAQFKLSRYLSKEYLAPLGLTLKLFLPRKLEKVRLKNLNLKSKKGKRETFYYQDLIPEEFYLKEVLKVLSSEQKVLIVVPDKVRLKKVESFLKDKIPKEKLLIFTKDLSSKKELEIFQKVNLASKGYVLVATKSSLFLPFSSLDLIILDHEDSFSYQSWGRTPKYNTLEVINFVSQLYQATLILSSKVPSLKTFKEIKEGKVKMAKSLNFKKIKMGPFKIVSLKEDLEFKKGKLLSQIAKIEILKKRTKEFKILILTPRKGESLALVCKDCGFHFKCPNCSVALRKTEGKKSLVCNWCRFELDPPDTCLNCKGINFKELGETSQRLKKELEKFVSDKILVLDANQKLKLQEKLIKDFKESKAFKLLIATSAILKFEKDLISKKDQILTIVSLADSFWFIPEMKTKEEFIRMIFSLRTFSKEVIIQTLEIPKELETNLKNPLTFLYQSLEETLRLNHPPFSQIVKIWREKANYQDLLQEALKLKTALENSPNLKAKIEVLGPSFGYPLKVKNKYQVSIFVQLKDRELKFDLIKLIPYNWNIEVNPESLIFR